MSAWLIDLFGSRQLNHAFWLISIAPLPAWIALVFFPRHRATRLLASPFLAPPLVALLYLWLLWKLGGLTPDAPLDPGQRSLRGYISHPVVFLLLWAHLQTANLFVAAVLVEDSRRRKLNIPVELALCWLFAPVSVVIYTLRRFTRRLSPTSK